MDIIQIVGRKTVNFTDTSGKHIEGTSLYYTMADPYTEGVVAGKIFLPLNFQMEIPEVDKTYEVDYNRYGRPAKFTLIK